jgi:hypothetical protein
MLVFRGQAMPGLLSSGRPDAGGLRLQASDQEFCFSRRAITLVGCMVTPTQPRKARMGCLTQVVLSLLMGVALVLAIDAVFAPWSFYMGGKFHAIPFWQGWGRLHAPAGDYLLFVTMTPSTGTRGVGHVTGNGVLCTPRGETFPLKLGADFEKNMGASTDGKRVYMYLHKKPPSFFRSVGDTRPSFDLHGAWHNPDMVLDDHGTLNREFMADGRLYNGDLHKQPGAHGPLPVTIKEGTRSDFDAACTAAKMR